MKRRVLFLTPYPGDCAPSQRLKFEQYYGFFEQQGIAGTVSPFVSRRFWKILYQPGHWAGKLFWSMAGYLRRFWDFFRCSRYHAVYIHLWALPFGPPWFEEALARRGIPVIYDIDDLIYLPKASRVNAFVRHFRKENRVARIMKAAKAVIVSSAYLKAFALRYNPFSVCISSTVNTDVYFPRTHAANPRPVTIGWSGSHSTAPYIRLIAPALQAVVKRHDVRLLVIGDPNFRLEGVRVEARPWLLARETADLAEMDIGLYPLPDEEWVLGKSGLKALQYMGMGVPVIASDIGAAREFIRNGENGFLVTGVEQWVERLVQLIEDTALRARLGSAGRKTVEERYSVKVNQAAYWGVLAQVLGCGEASCEEPTGVEACVGGGRF